MTRCLLFLQQWPGIQKGREHVGVAAEIGIDSDPGIPANEIFARLEDKARQLATAGSP